MQRIHDRKSITIVSLWAIYDFLLETIKINGCLTWHNHDNSYRIVVVESYPVGWTVKWDNKNERTTSYVNEENFAFVDDALDFAAKKYSEYLATV